MNYEDEQYKADIEKAIALSLETLEIEKCKQKLLNSGKSGRTSQEALKEYQEYLARKKSLIENKPLQLPPKKTFEPPPLPARNVTPPKPSVDESDLINFASESKPPDPHEEFLKYVGKLQETAPTPQRSMSMVPAVTNYGFSPQFPSNRSTPSVGSLDMVPYVPAKPVKLTREELDRLYTIQQPYFGPPKSQSITTHPFYQNPQMPFSTPQPMYQHTQIPFHWPAVNPTNPFGQTFQVPSPSPTPTPAPVPQSSPELPPKPSTPSIRPAPSTVMNNSTASRSKSFSGADYERVTLRSKHTKNSNGEDLIDLDNGFDDNRVSVLEAFDPLLSGYRSSSEDEKGDNASYYSEYDPFEYIYSGGTQYSDPVYEAVNRQDKTPISPSLSEYYEPELEFESTEPPPLPPRKEDLYRPMSSKSQIYEAMSQPSNLHHQTTPKKLYENVVIRKSYDKELVSFYEMVKNLRATYKFDDEETNPGHVIAAESEFKYGEKTSIKLLVHPSFKCYSGDVQIKGQFEEYGPPVHFTCDTTTSVEHVIMHVYCSLEGQIYGSKSPTEDYVLRPVGIQEFVSPKSKLNQLDCVHNSVKLDLDVQLAFCRRTNQSMKVIARTAQDDRRDSELKLEDILPREPTFNISYDDVMILLETLETEIDKLESAAVDNNPRTILSCSGVVQAVKAICNLLGPIDTLDIHSSIEELKQVCSSGQTIYHQSPRYGLGNIASENGDYAEVTLRPRTTAEQIKYCCNEVRNSIQSLLEIYSQAFRVNFCVNLPEWKQQPRTIIEFSRPVKVHIMCLHRPPLSWRYDDYMLGCQIYHGTRYISDAIVTQCSNEMSGIYPRLTFDSQMTFRNVPICTLPREARLIFVLYGSTKEPVEGADGESGPNSNGRQEEKVTKVELGWASIQFFDFERKMIQGPYLLSLWPPTTEKYFGSAPAKGTHPLADRYPILGIKIADSGYPIVFPEPMADIPNAPSLDFSSLDKNLQQELIDTAEQGYTWGKLDKREVLWEKRHYLQAFPHALPRVLHAAHSWDYACLSDLHALLRSWTPLSPRQALELLLPNYPDLEVRAYAVRWISHMTNNEMIDFLPQLLQALKHDTYESSPLAALLLGRSLESPRIAHHLYWLLVHSLPGEAPQNIIESFEKDETFINQSRFHRRNQLMLRALLAICGEKLTARFMTQNMMSKSLAEVANSVKLTKESLRIQILKQGLESVNQILLDNPTSLPLGPGQEVHGINIRSCSYFNSNTLPLRINFVGPDKSILPAIFKCGDDLQQDMIVIQMVRLMDKLWLKEGLNLKIVTFNCVPTGHKKGMIEMVSDAETLRKIQTEWGLTGSFKDKSIAEWLAKQNPSQLDYQKAVDNFTVSCAGYCVATYILGICDRHNDNIMLKTSGHLFHIDFGKFLGDAQMFGNFKRDRTPFVLTSDMAYVINGCDRPSIRFHRFVDICCTAFNIVRKHGNFILHMFALMATSGIPGVTAEAVNYVRNALLPGQSNPEAAANFAKMIHISLKSWFTQFNFFLHNIAQMKFSSETDDGELLSFIPKRYTMGQDGRLKSVTVHGYQKRYESEKYYMYILKVTRQNQPDPSYLFRSYKEFCEFHQKLCLHFPLVKLHSLPSGIHVGRSNIKTVAERRLPEIRQFLISLFDSADEISHSDLVYTFFHPILRDQQETDITARKVRGLRPISDVEQPVRGEVKLSLQYHREALIVMIHHARSLSISQSSNQEPNTYVKVYLKPDRSKMTKRKTKVVRKNCNPSFMETLEYRLPLEFIQAKVMEVTVWSHDSLQENEFLGGFELKLADFNLREEIIGWYQLSYLPRN